MGPAKVNRHIRVRGCSYKLTITTQFCSRNDGIDEIRGVIQRY